jgi:predicted MFS family arabinose efflux permease
MISDYYPPESRATALSFYSSGIYVGILIGYAFGGVLAEALGWRAAFMVVGIPGVVFAVLLLLTVREPLRGRWEKAGTADTRPSFTQTLRYLKGKRSFWYVALGSALSAFVGYGNGNFFPSLLIRIHGMNVADVGLVLSLVAGTTGAIGTFAGGYLADRLGAKDRRWYAWVPLAGGLLSFIPGLYVLLGDNTVSVLSVLFFVSIVNSLYLGPSIAISHALVPPRMRAVTSAVLFFILNMIGLGLGPFFTGLVSDLLAPAYGELSLRYAMLCTAGIGTLAMWMYYQASRSLTADLDAAG